MALNGHGLAHGCGSAWVNSLSSVDGIRPGGVQLGTKIGFGGWGWSANPFLMIFLKMGKATGSPQIFFSKLEWPLSEKPICLPLHDLNG